VALTRMMRSVVEEGTAQAAQIPGYSVAGKTGTAQKIGPDGRYSTAHFVASFVGFAPASRPALTILVVLDEPRGSMFHGGDIAAPAFARIALPALRHLGVAPDQELEEPEERNGRFLQVKKRDNAPSSRMRWMGRMGRTGRTARTASVTPMTSREMCGTETEAMSPVPLPPPSADGSEQVVLADLHGHSLRRAVTYLGRAGLKARVVSAQARNAEPIRGGAVVAAQNPAPGSRLSRGMEVELRPGMPAARIIEGC